MKLLTALVLSMAILPCYSWCDEGKSSPLLNAEELMKRVEETYASAATYSSRFDQVYATRNFGEVKSSGEVYFKRPGMMKWLYTAPSKKIIASYRNNLWIWDKRDSQVILDRHFTQEKVPTTISFLWAGKRMKEVFDYRLISVEERGSKRTYTVELKPKEDIPTVSSLNFLVDGDSFTIKATILFDPLGNENRLYFKRIAFDEKLDDSFFRFDPPQGVEVVEPPVLKR